MSRRLAALGLVAGLGLATTLTACAPKEPPMPVRAVDSAKELVDRYARSTLDYSGQPGFSRATVSPTSCQGRGGERSDTIYAILGTYQLLVPATEQPAVIAKVRAGWTAHGYTITEDRSFPPDGTAEPGGQISATSPADGLQLIFGTGVQPAMFLQITTACYQPPAGDPVHSG